MKNLDDVTDFMNQILSLPYKYPGDSYNPTDNERYTLQSVGGFIGDKRTNKISLEIWYEDYNLTDKGIDKRYVYNIDIKMKEVSANEVTGSK